MGRLEAPPALLTALEAQDAIARLDKLARRGKLPGFAVHPDSNRFEVAVFGEPFDRRLVGQVRADADGQQRRVEFTLQLKPKAPVIGAVVVALTVWPGVLLTDSLIPGRWGWWPTWWWYIPLVVVPLPFMLPKMWRKSEGIALEHLGEQHERIRSALDATVAAGE